MSDFASTLMRLWPNGDEKVKGLRAGMIATAPAVFAKYGIDNPLVLAHLMAQISHECGAGHDVVENLSYSAIRMTQVWPSRFPNTAAAAPYANNPRALANKVYNGVKPDGSDRMGNRPSTDDGWNFRGRGASQTTGRDGYERVFKNTGLDVVNNPDILIDPQYFLLCGVADFINCGCLPYAKADDVLNVTKRLNGGTVGLDQRVYWLKRWKEADVSVPTGPMVALPVEKPKPSIISMETIKPGPRPVNSSGPPPSITNPAKGSIGAFIASIFNAIFKRKP